MAKKTEKPAVAFSPSEFRCSCGSVLKGTLELKHPKKAGCPASEKKFRRPTFQPIEL